MTDLNTEILDLKKTNLFKNFPNNKLQCLSFTSEASSYDKGELIFFEKDFPKELYILIEGKVEKYNASKKALFQPASLLNEDSFLT